MRRTLGLLVIAIAMVSTGLAPAGSSVPAASRLPARVAVEAALLRQQVEVRVLEWVERDEMARSDGYVYTVEVGELLAYAARARNEQLYLRLRAFAVQNLIRDDPSDPYTRGFVL